MKKLLPILLAIAVVAVIAFGVVTWLHGNKPDEPEPPAPPSATGPTQPDWCPTVEVIAAPGTWESAPWDDPENPTFNPHALLLGFTQPLKEHYAANPGDVKVWTLPYTAQFRNVQADQEMTYDDSRVEGTNRMVTEMTSINSECPLTDFILVGFSQGAIIAGDFASEAGNGRAPIPAERIRGVALVADGRREAAHGQHVGAPVPGVGAEISLHPLNDAVQLVMPGATMRGPRAGGFGTLDPRVVEICAPGDHICSAPTDVNDALARARHLFDHSGVHAQYATNMAVFGNQTAPQWLVDWAIGLIDNPQATGGSPNVTTVPPIP